MSTRPTCLRLESSYNISMFDINRFNYPWPVATVLCTKFARKLVPTFACSISASSPVISYSSLRFWLSIGRLAIVSERKSTWKTNVLQCPIWDTSSKRWSGGYTTHIEIFKRYNIILIGNNFEDFPDSTQPCNDDVYTIWCQQNSPESATEMTTYFSRASHLMRKPGPSSNFIWKAPIQHGILLTGRSIMLWLNDISTYRTVSERQARRRTTLYLYKTPFDRLINIIVKTSNNTRTAKLLAHQWSYIYLYNIISSHV